MFNQSRWSKQVQFLGLVVIVLIVALLSAAGGPLVNVSAAPLAATSPVGLGTAGRFAVLAGSAVNDSNPSVVKGDVGLSPASGAFIFLTCPEVTGTIFSVDASGPLPCRKTNAGLLTTAKNDLTTAFNNAAGRVATTVATELGNTTKIDGVYDSASTTFQISNIGALTLDAQGDPNAVFIFKMGSTAASLVTGSNSKVELINGAQSCNVFWQVSGSATLGTGSTFVGTIMADQSIVDDGGSTVDGRFLARIAAVTLNNTTISRSNCAPTPTNTPLSATQTAIAATKTLTAVAQTATAIALLPTQTRRPGGGGGGGNQATSAPTEILAATATPTETVPAVLPTTGGSGSDGLALVWFASGVAGAALVGFPLLLRGRRRRKVD